MSDLAALRGFYAIADVDTFEARGISLEKGVSMLLASGAPIVQIRWKSGSAGRLLTAARLLVKMSEERGVMSIVNDRVDIAAAVGARGVHLGQNDLPVAAARKVLPPGTLVGVSTHDLDQVDAALSDGADYIGFGPVYATGTKANPEPVVGLEGLAGAVNRVAGRMPVVAIGGMNLGRVGKVALAGADLVAVISDVIGDLDPAARGRAVHERMLGGKGESQ